MNIEALLPYFILFLVIVVTIVVMGCLIGLSRLKEDNRILKVKQEKDQRLLRQFTDKLARVDNVYESLFNITCTIYEELQAESVGIYILDTSVGASENQVVGESCVGPFPFFTGTGVDGLTDSARKTHFKTEIIKSGEGLLGNVIQSLHRYCLDVRDNHLIEYSLPAQVKTMMAMPLIFEGRFIGLVVAVNRRHTYEPFSSKEMDAFDHLSVLIALAVNFVIIYQERQRQDRIVQELNSYARLQKLLLPQVPGGVKDYRFASYQAPALEVSGDFYDFGMLNDHQILVIIADATGKNLPACLITSMCRSFVRCLKDHFTDMKTFLLDLNRLLYTNTDDAQFITLNALLLDIETNHCVFGCAGHTPLMIRQPDGTVTTLKPAGPALGMWDNGLCGDFETESFEFLPGMKLLLYTDGINEAANDQGELYGEERLKALLAASTELPGKIVAKIIDHVHDFSNGMEQADDQTMMMLSRRKDGKIYGA